MLTAIVVLFRLWLFLSPLVFFPLLFLEDSRAALKRKHGIKYGIGSWVVFIGLFSSLVVAWQGVIDPSLSFIPDSWGSDDEDGEFMSLRTSLTGVLAVALSFACVVVFDNFARLRDLKQRRNQFILDAASELGSIQAIAKGACSEYGQSELKSKLAELEAKLRHHAD